jgi:S-adenosylmethionine:tRNA ribosyltransferase-isomerase
MSAVAVPAPSRSAREADRSPESRGLARDEVRMLVSGPDGEEDRSFLDLAELLDPGDLLVVNESATLPASLPASGAPGPFLVNLSTEFGPGVWLAEPRWSPSRPGPLPLPDGAEVDVAGLSATVLERYPTIPRLAFFRFGGDIVAAAHRYGRPIRYGYLAEEYPLATYQTAFARVPGSAEMPSAGRPFSERALARLERKGIRLAPIVLHTAVSSLEDGDDVTGAPPILPEPYDVPASTVEAIDATRRERRRVLAVGTTVVRALESARDGCALRASRGFSRRYLAPPTRASTVDGLLTGFHTARTTHLALLSAVAGVSVVERAYAHATAQGYLWHEFGDVHLLLSGEGPAGGRAGRVAR